MTPRTPVGLRIQQAQEEAGKPKNADVAKALGVSLRLYSKWRAGTVTPRYENLAKLAAFYERPVSWFFTEDDEKAVA